MEAVSNIHNDLVCGRTMEKRDNQKAKLTNIKDRKLRRVVSLENEGNYSTLLHFGKR